MGNTKNITESKYLQLTADLGDLFFYQNNSQVDKITKSFELIGSLVYADRIYMFKNFHETESVYMSQIFEWTRSSQITKQIDNYLLKKISYDNFPTIYSQFSKNIPYHAIVSQIDNVALREILSHQDIKSILLVPIFIDSVLWGYVGYDNCTNETLFEEYSISILKLFSNYFSSFMLSYTSKQRLHVFVNIFDVPALAFDEKFEMIAANAYCTTNNELVRAASTLVRRMLYELTQSNKFKINGKVAYNGEDVVVEASKIYDADVYTLIDSNLYLVLVNKKAHTDVESDVSNFNMLEKNKELEAQNAYMSQYISRISHDLKSPARNLLGFTKLLKKQLDKPENKELTISYLTFVSSTTEKIYSIVEGLSVFSMVKNKSMVLKSVNVKDLIDFWVLQYKKTYNTKKINYVNTISHAIVADRDLINIAISNLISNAFKYSSKNEDYIEIRCISNRVDDKIEVVIADNGCGFDMASYGNIFQFMGRLHTEEEYTGVGIGLSTVKLIMEKMKGDIHLISAIGKGTKAILTLPNIDF